MVLKFNFIIYLVWVGVFFLLEIDMVFVGVVMLFVFGVFERMWIDGGGGVLVECKDLNLVCWFLELLEMIVVEFLMDDGWFVFMIIFFGCLIVYGVFFFLFIFDEVY